MGLSITCYLPTNFNHGLGKAEDHQKVGNAIKYRPPCSCQTAMMFVMPRVTEAATKPKESVSLIQFPDVSNHQNLPFSNEE